MDNDNLKEFESVEIVATSMDTQYSTFSYVKSENEAPLDVQEIHVDDIKHRLRTLLKSQRICQWCKQICTHDFTPMKDLECDLILNLNIPKMKFSYLSDSVVCLSCLDLLKARIHSTKHRSDLQAEIFNTSEENEGPSFIKIEPIEIKSEEDLDRIRDDESCGDQTSQNYQITQPTPMYQSDKRECKTTYKYDLDRHQQHTDISDLLMYKCDVCTYKTKSRYTFDQHQLKHKDKSEVPIYRCHVCNHETKYRNNLAMHQLIHKNVPEALMYKCDKCEYKTKFKVCLKSHLGTHEGGPGTQMYRCETCGSPFKTKLRLRRHQVVHGTFLGERMYKCDTCSYQSSNKTYFIRHHQRHTVVSEAQMYKCDRCAYKSKYKSQLKVHREKHEVRVQN